MSSASSFKLNIKTDTTKKAIRFYRLTQKKLHTYFLKHMLADPVKEKLLREAIKVIKSSIYAVYKPKEYVRTMDLLNSFKVDSTKKKTALTHLWLYSDPNVATSKTDPEISYAAYFEDESFGSFLLDKDPSIKPIRPFFDKLILAFDSVVAGKGIIFLEKALEEIYKEAYKK